ncbi:hypothetical protein GCM10008101_26560 [Lysobacter xinjiangensis]|uniref:Type II secretion system (T2SS), protein M subtype b n=1 Tax=Cognatilysobacter xinjiangensis TaxID=546892 RepID=A0ABQ3C9K9_9GAMM|nr:hypothetical protein [Lysobacter xinjiangensis]GGZ70885.1 hypothetical protein GCM10008101_26560 [Lysobacter xinjiangensis]
MNAFRLSVERVRQELRQNARLRWGAVAIGAVLAFYAFLVLRDWRADLHARYIERRQYLRKVRALAGQTEWIEHAREAARARKALEAQLPVAGSQGLAQAAALTWVRQMAAVHGPAVQVQSQAAQPVDGSADLWRVPVSISGSLPPKAVLNLVQQIEKRPALSVIERSMVLNRENKTFELTVVSFVRIPGAGDESGR